MEFWVNLSAILQIPASIVAVVGLNAFQIIQYYRKKKSPNLASSVSLQTPSHSNKINELNTFSDHELNWLDLSMALLVASIPSSFFTYITTCFVRIITYFPFPVKKSELPSFKDILAFNFHDPRFIVGLAFGILTGMTIGGWIGRSALRSFSQGKGLIDWLID